MGTGEWAALAAALMWTCSSMIWGRINLPALTLNFFKNWIGVVLILIHMLILGAISNQTLFSAPPQSWGWLAISGVVGIVIGDTFFFRSLQILGPRKALMVATTAPLFSAVLASVLLNESLAYTAILGVVMTVAGVVIVVADRKAAKEAPGLMPGDASLGAVLGVLGAICQSVGGVLSKKGMVGADGEPICNAVEATFIRIFVAAIATAFLIMAAKKARHHLINGIKPEMLRFLIPATAIGTWLGIWFSQIAFQQSDVAIAQTLLATCPLFAIPVVWYSHKHKVTALAFFGTAISIAGIYLTVR